MMNASTSLMSKSNGAAAASDIVITRANTMTRITLTIATRPCVTRLETGSTLLVCATVQLLLGVVSKAPPDSQLL